MALTDNRTRLQDCQDDADFATTGSQLNPNTLAGNTLITPNSVQVQHSNVYDDTYATVDSAAASFNLDLSASTVYVAVKDNGYDVAEVVGAGVVVGDGTDRIGYQAGGSNALGLPYQKVFNVFKIDLSETDANPGSADVGHHVFSGSEANFSSAAVTNIGYGGIHNAKAQGNVANVFISGIYYDLNTDYHATVSGGSSGTPETMTDLVGDDETVGAAMFSNPIGDAFYLYANTEFGDAGTGSSGFEGTDQQWYYLGDNGGGRVIGAGNFIFRLVGNSTGTNAFRQTRVVNINTGTRAPFDMSHADFDELELQATTWINFGAITFPANDVSKFCNNSTFVNGDQMILSSLDMDGNTWNGSNDAGGAIVWDETVADQEKQVNSTFVRNGTHNAIEIAPTGAGPFTYDVDGLVVDGFASQDDVDAVETEKVFFINPSTLSADININLANSEALNIGGGADTGTEGFSYRVVGSYTGTVTITQTVTLAVTVTDADDGTALEDVFVSIRNASTNALISEGRTTAAGLYQDTGYNYTGDLAVTINVRKSSPGDTRYLPTLLQVKSPPRASTSVSTARSATMSAARQSLRRSSCRVVRAGSWLSPGSIGIRQQTERCRHSRTTAMP
jgi:hypothetical protein